MKYKVGDVFSRGYKKIKIVQINYYWDLKIVKMRDVGSDRRDTWDMSLEVLDAYTKVKE